MLPLRTCAAYVWLSEAWWCVGNQLRLNTHAPAPEFPTFCCFACCASCQGFPIDLRARARHLHAAITSRVSRAAAKQPPVTSPLLSRRSLPLCRFSRPGRAAYSSGKLFDQHRRLRSAARRLLITDWLRLWFGACSAGRLCCIDDWSSALSAGPCCPRRRSPPACRGGSPGTSKGKQQRAAAAGGSHVGTLRPCHHGL